MTTTNAGGIKIQLQAETEKWNRAIDSAVGRLNKIGGAAVRVGVIAGAAFAGLSAAITKVTIAASEQRKSVNRLTATAKANGKISEAGVRRLTAQAAALQTVTTFGDEATISMQAQLAAYSLSESAVAALTPRVQDLAAALGKDLMSATSVIGRAVGGQIGGLARYGIVLSKSETAAFNAANEGQRLAMILKRIDVAVGGTAKIVAATAQGAMKQFGNAIGDVYEELGFIMEQDTAKFFRSMTRHVESVIGALAGMSDGVKLFLARGARVALIVLGVVTALSTLAVILPSVIAGFQMMAAAVTVAAGPLLTFLLVAGAIIVVAATMRKAWEDNLGGVQEAWQTTVNFLAEGWAFIRGGVVAVADFLSKAFEFAFRNVMNVFTLLPRMIISGVSNIIAVLEELMSAAKIAARFLGFEDTAKSLASAAGVLSKAKNEVRGIEQSILDASAMAAEAANPVKAISTAVDFWAGAEGTGFVSDLTKALENSGDYIADGLKLLVNDALGMPEFLKKMLGDGGIPDDDQPTPPGATGPSVISTESMEMIRAMRSLSNEFDVMRAGPMGDLVSTTQAMKERFDGFSTALVAGTVSSDEYRKANEQLSALASSELAARVSSRTNLRDFNAALEAARESAKQLGLDFGDISDQARFVPDSLSSVLNSRVGDFVDAILTATGSNIDAADSSEITDTISGGIADLMRGGSLDFSKIGSALGQMFGSTKAGSDILGRLMGGIGAAGSVAAGPQGLAVGATAGASAGPAGAAIGTAIAAVAAVAAPMIISAFEGIADNAGAAMKAILFGLGELIPEQRLQRAIDEGVSPLMLGFAGIAAILLPVLIPAMAYFAGWLVFAATVLAALTPVLVLTATAFAALVGFATVVGVVLGVLWTIVGVIASSLIALVSAIVATGMALLIILNPVVALIAVVVTAVAAVGLFIFSIIAAVGAILILGAVFASMVGFLAKLATETEAFGAISDMFSASVGRIVSSLEPFVKGLEPLVGLFDAFADVIIAFAESVFSGDAIIRLVFETMKGMAVALGHVVVAAAIVGDALLQIVTGVSYGIFAILGAISGPVETFIDVVLTALSLFVGGMSAILGLFSEGAGAAMAELAADVDSLRGQSQVGALQDALAAVAAAANQARPDIAGMSSALAVLTNMSMAEAQARADNLRIMEDFSSSLTNVPEAVKVARLRYDSVQPGIGAAVSPIEGGNGATVINIGEIQILAENTGNVLEQIMEAAESASMRDRGTTQSRDAQNNGG